MANYMGINIQSNLHVGLLPSVRQLTALNVARVHASNSETIVYCTIGQHDVRTSSKREKNMLKY